MAVKRGQGITSALPLRLKQTQRLREERAERQRVWRAFLRGDGATIGIIAGLVALLLIASSWLK